jgi:DNA-binding CsgD family transcriptional regulator
MDDHVSFHLRLVLILALASIVAGGTLDLAMDQPRDWLSFHVVFESLMIVGALLMAVTLWLGWWHAEQSIHDLEERLEARRTERDEWQKSATRALQGLGEAIDTQFRAWGLTRSEREVALLLLKGYSHKRLARETGRSERTARQHAASVYRKAGLANRSELAAYFLEGLLLPPERAPASG